MLGGERRRLGHSEEFLVALVWPYVNATYELLRPKLTNLTESIASAAEKLLQVRASIWMPMLRRARCSGRDSRHVGSRSARRVSEE
jgi:hypothetical protein